MEKKRMGRIKLAHARQTGGETDVSRRCLQEDPYYHVWRAKEKYSSPAWGEIVNPGVRDYTNRKREE